MLFRKELDMDIRYFVVRNHEVCPAYGIAAVAVDDCWYICQLFQDICREYHRICELVRVCNDLQLDPIHLPEVIDDFLAEV